MDRGVLARHIASDISDARLAAGVRHVELDEPSFTDTVRRCDTIFQATDAILDCARADTDGFPRAVITAAFADYIATRWIFWEIWRFRIRQRPIDREFPPPFRNADAKRGLAETLASNAMRVGAPVKERQTFINGATRWQWVSDARTALINRAMVLVMFSVATSSLHAQVVDPGSNDQIVGAFLQKAKGDDFRGGIVSRGDQTLPSVSRLKVAWQVDYGSLGARRPTSTSATPGEEPDVSKNTGVYTASYVRRFGALWRVTGDGGAEHRRLAKSDGTTRNQVSTLVNASVRNIGARLLGSNPDRAPEMAWSLQANIATSHSILQTSESREIFLDPVVVMWLSLWPSRMTRNGEAPRLFNRVQLRAEGAAMRPFDDDIDAEGHWDAAVLFFFTPENAVMLRQFSGFFDHNLRNRKNAVTLNLLWKFR